MPGRGCRRELEARLDGPPRRVDDLLAGVLVDELRGELVLDAARDVPVCHRVDDLGAGHGRHVLVGVEAVGRGRADRGRNDLDGLRLVGQVLMGGEQAAARVVELLARHDRVAGQVQSREARLDLHRHAGRRGLEFGGHRGLADGKSERLAVGRVLQRGLEPVGIALHQARHRNRVEHRLLGRDGERLLPGVGVLGLGRHYRRGVVDGAQIDSRRVAPDGEAVVDELLALVGRAGQLLDRVLVVGERAHRSAVGLRPEPHAAFRVELGLVDREAGLGVALQCRIVGVAGVGGE